MDIYCGGISFLASMSDISTTLGITQATFLPMVEMLQTMTGNAPSCQISPQGHFPILKTFPRECFYLAQQVCWSRAQQRRIGVALSDRTPVGTRRGNVPEGAGVSPMHRSETGRSGVPSGTPR